MNRRYFNLFDERQCIESSARYPLVFGATLLCSAQEETKIQVRSFVTFLITLGAGKPTPEAAPADTVRGRLKRDYEEYLRRERGLSERTIFHSWRFVDRFLTFRFGKEVGDLSEITAIDITAFLQQLTTRKPPSA